MREPGKYDLEELISDTDGSLAYRVPDSGVRSAASGSWEAATGDLDTGIMWTVSDLDPDDLEPEVGMTTRAYAALVRRARRHCEACTGPCDRNGA